MSSKSAVLPTITLVVLLLASCGSIPVTQAPPPTPTPDPEQPQITDITLSPEVVQPGQQVAVTVKAVDPQQDPLTYTWSAQNGQIRSGPTQSTSNNYTAPNFTVDDIVTVVVTDAEGHVAKKRKYVRVVTEAQVTAVTQGTPLPSLPPLPESTTAPVVATVSPNNGSAKESAAVTSQTTLSNAGTVGSVQGKNEHGLSIQPVASVGIAQDTGFSVSTKPSTEKENGELEVVITTPDGKPYVQTYVAIHSQKTDLNNQLIRGERVAEFRTDENGSGIVKLPPGEYGVWPSELTGLPWTGLNFDKPVEVGRTTVVKVVPSRLTVVIRRADGSLIKNSYVSVSTQKTDANNKPLYDERVREGRTQDTGEITFDLSPGTYALYFEAARGEDWGVFNNYILPATQVNYALTLGRIRIESRNDKGDVAPGFYSRVVLQEKDANNKTIPGDRVSEGRTDDTGVFNHDITPGTYLVQSDAGDKAEVIVKSGETIVLKNTDFQKQ